MVDTPDSHATEAPSYWVEPFSLNGGPQRAAVEAASPNDDAFLLSAAPFWGSREGLQGERRHFFLQRWPSKGHAWRIFRHR